MKKTLAARAFIDRDGTCNVIALPDPSMLLVCSAVSFVNRQPVGTSISDFNMNQPNNFPVANLITTLFRNPKT